MSELGGRCGILSTENVLFQVNPSVSRLLCTSPVSFFLIFYIMFSPLKDLVFNKSLVLLIKLINLQSYLMHGSFYLFCKM